MQLTRFKVTNFRSGVDSGWVEAERVTAFIGINESGKSNLLLPLWKLNPARDGEIVPTSDYPKANYAAVRADPSAFTFIRAEFALGNPAERLVALTGHDRKNLEVVQVSRDFGNGLEILFPGCIPAQAVDGADVSGLLTGAARELEATTPLAKEGMLKTEMLKRLQAAEVQTRSQVSLSADELAALQKQLSGALPESTAATSSLVPRFKRLLEAIQGMESKLRIRPPHENKEACDLVTKHLPSFVYYSNYGNLDSEIYLPHVVQNLKRDKLGTKEAGKVRTLRVLFRFVHLEPEEILEMGQEVKAPQGQAPTEADTSATRPSLPTRRKSPADTIPDATHRNISGAMAVRISRRKMSPRILHWIATAGASSPTAMPRSTARRICAPRPRQAGRLRDPAAAAALKGYRPARGTKRSTRSTIAGTAPR